jgi:hypothetical protein
MAPSSTPMLLTIILTFLLSRTSRVHASNTTLVLRQWESCHPQSEDMAGPGAVACSSTTFLSAGCFCCPGSIMGCIEGKENCVQDPAPNSEGIMTWMCCDASSGCLPDGRSGSGDTGSSSSSSSDGGAAGSSGNSGDDSGDDGGASETTAAPAAASSSITDGSGSTSSGGSNDSGSCRMSVPAAGSIWSLIGLALVVAGAGRV